MKKVLLSIVCVLSICLSVCAMTFTDAFNQSGRKPMAAVIYAPWSEGNQSVLNTINSLKPKYNSVFNFAELDISTPETKFFNTRYVINTNLPYIMLFKDNGRNFRLIPQNCANNRSCLEDKMKLFAN